MMNIKGTLAGNTNYVAGLASLMVALACLTTLVAPVGTVVGVLTTKAAFPVWGFFWMFFLPLKTVIATTEASLILKSARAFASNFFAAICASNGNGASIPEVDLVRVLATPFEQMLSTAEVAFISLGSARNFQNSLAAKGTDHRQSLCFSPFGMMVFITEVKRAFLDVTRNSSYGFSAKVAGYRQSLCFSPFGKMRSTTKMVGRWSYIAVAFFKGFSAKGTDNCHHIGLLSIPEAVVLLATKVMSGWGLVGIDVTRVRFTAKGTGQFSMRHFTLPTRVLTFIEEWRGRCQVPAYSGQLARLSLADNHYTRKGELWQAHAVA